MRVDGKPGEAYLRWSGGKLQFVNGSDGTVLMEVDPSQNVVEAQELNITSEANLTGRVFLAGGEVLAPASDINNAGSYSRNQKVYVGSLAAAAAADAIVFSWTNPEGKAVIVTRVLVHVTTAGGTGGATLDVGSAANATTGSNNLITGGDINTTAAYDSLDIAGEGVATFQIVPDGECVNGQAKTEKAEALAGKYYIFYVVAD